MADHRLLSRRDLDFLLYEWLDVETLTKRERFAAHSREIFDSVLALSAEIAAEKFAPCNRLVDTNEPYVGQDGRVVLVPEIGEALAAYLDAGLQTGAFGTDVGGMQLPMVVHSAASAWFQAANIGAFSYPFLAVGNANLVIAHGSPDQVERFAKPIVEGRYFGTMCLSEPQAGSSLSDIASRAQRQDDGTYRLTGSKMWISAGEHELSENIVHLVLARIPGAPAGVKGISLFIVPKFLVGDDGTLGERNDVSLVGLNHKMGYRGTTNTLLNLGEGRHSPHGRAGAIGYLVGEEHRGLSYMFHMMNEARIIVGTGAVALGYTAYLHSLDYARTRLQGRPVEAKDPNSPPVAIIEHPDVRRMLLAQKSYVEGGLALVLYCARLVDETTSAPDEDARAASGALLDLLTPIAKSWPSQYCLAANDLGIQIHGGYGYTRDYPVEQFYRDNRLNSIHEGTHGVQALDLLGRKVLAGRGASLARLIGEMERTSSAAADDPALVPYAEALRAAVTRLQQATTRAWADGDPALALANATAYLEATGHVVVAWLWLEQLLAAAGRDGAFYAGKRAAAQYFFRYELPSVHTKYDLVDSLDRTTLDLDPGVL